MLDWKLKDWADRLTDDDLCRKSAEWLGKNPENDLGGREAEVLVEELDEVLGGKSVDAFSAMSADSFLWKEAKLLLETLREWSCLSWGIWGGNWLNEICCLKEFVSGLSALDVGKKSS